tara:strand:- start:1464 stop:9512 length:8049 start_codon:yes stop_codon:yes gene_type:complete
VPTYRVKDSVTGVTLDLTGDSPPTEAELTKIFASYEDQQNNQAAIADSLADERTFLGQAGETLKAIPRGFANSFLSAGEGVAELSDAATNVVGLEDAIASGDDNALVSASREGRKLVDEYMGADEAYRDTWMTKFGEGIGSFASFFTPATVFRAAGIAGKGIKAFGGMGSREAAATGVLAAGQMSGDQAQRIQAARDAGITVSENQEDAAIVMSGFVGLSEMVLPAMLLKRLAPDALTKLPGNTMEMLGSALRSGSVEGVQEVVAGIAQNAIERGVYNEQAELVGPTLYDDFTIGGAVGAGADLVLNAIAGRRNKNSFESAAEAEGKAREDYEDQIELRSQLLTRDLEIQERQDQEAALLESRRESDILLAGQQDIDSSQIQPPEGRAVSDKLRTPSRVVNVVDETGQSFQAEEKTKVRNKGKNTETTVTYIEVPGGGEIVTSTKRLNQPAVAEDTGLQITTLSEGGGSLERRYPKHPMEAYAHHIRRVMGDNFPSADNSFSVNLPKGFEGRDRFGQRIYRAEETTTQLEEGAPVFTVVDSIGQQFGVPLENANDAFALASYLNNEIINDNVFSGGEAIIASSPESYDEQQRKTLQFYNFAVNSPDANTYTSVAVNSAAETTQDRGFDEVADVRKLLDDGVDLSDMTASQRINAKRLRKGLPVTNKFTIEEVRDVLNNDQLYNLSDTRVNGLPETETYKAGFSKKGNPVVRSSAGETLRGRPLTIAEKESALEANPKKKPPKIIKFKTEADARAYANQLNNTTNQAAVDKGVMRNVDANYQEMENLLRAKNITSEVNSPEIKYLAGRILGRKKLTSRGSWSYANDLSVADARLLYEKLRQLPRFDKPTKLPFFELPKYTGAQFRAAVKELRNNPDANKYTLASATKINIATEEGDQALSDLRKAISDQGILSSQPEPIQAPEPIEPGKEIVPFEQKPIANIERLRASIAKVMKGFGLSDVAVNLDFALNTAARTADGNLVYGVRRRREGDIDSMVIGGEEGSQLFVKADDIDPEGRAEAYYDDTLNTIFLSIDKVAADNSLTEEQIEANLLSVLDHEMIHAMRKLDLFTNNEFNLLTRAASKKLHPTDRDRNGNPQTFLSWATANYGQDFDRARVIEESVAELVRQAKADPSLLQGKPRSLVQRIARFFRNMVASLRGEQFNTFSEVMAGIESGEIGGRSRGEIRTMYRTERDGRPAQAPQGAAQPTVITTGEEERGRVGQPRMADFSRRPQLSPLGQAASRGMTNIDLMPTPEELVQMKNNTYKPEQKRTLVEAVQLLQDRWQRATGRTEPFEYTTENIDIISDMLATEALSALENDSNAIGWYDSKLKAAKAVMQLVEPRIGQSPDTDALFDFGLAVTSNGQAVVDNFKMATDIFRFHMKKGRFPETKKEFDKGGERNAAMLEAFKFHNAYSKSGQNQLIREFLDEDFTVRDLGKFASDFNAEVGFDAINVPGAEGADVVVKGSYILGPKIGQGFYQNIRGNYDPLTMDIWWMRMWNRAIGRPFTDGLGDEARVERRNELKTLVKKTGGLPRKLINEVLKGNDQTRTEVYQDPQLFDEFIRDVERRYQRFYKEYKAEKGVNHVKPEIFKKTGTYVKNMAPQLQATPRGVVERAYMREVVDAAKERLSEAGYDINTADFQALMWYPEKQLFRALGVQPGRGSDNDYLDAAEILAEKEGVPRGRIEKALRDADRKRTDDGEPSARRQDGLVRRDAARADGQEEGPAFSRRAPRLEPKRIPDSQVEEAVDQHIVTADQSLAGFIPRFNPGVDPYVQAVAADPSKGAVLSPEDRAMFSRANSPERPEKVQSAMDSMLVANPEDETPGDTYLNVLDQGPIGELLTRVKQGAVFQYAQIEAYENKFDREVLASSAAIPALMAADRSNAITAQSIANGVVVYKDGLTKVEDFEHTFTEGSDRAGETVSFRGLIDVMGMLFSKEHGSLEQDAQAYAIAKRAEGLRARGIDSPGSKEEHQLVIRNAEAYLDENGNSIIKDWYDAWQGYNSYTIKFLRDTGVLTEEMADIWAAQSDYVPFYRQAMGEDLTTIPNMFNNLTSKSTFKPIKGSEKQLNVPLLDAIVMNLSAAIDMGMKNVAQQRVVRNMVRYGLSKEIQPGEPVDGRATVSFRVDGKDRKFTIEDPLVYQSLQPLAGGNGFDILETVLGKPANLLREMVTREPGFVLANMMRDTLSAYVTSGANFVPIFDTVAGFTKNMEDLERTGVVGGYDYSKDPKDIGKYLNNLLQERGFTENTTLGVARPFIGLWNFLGNVTTRSDFATRKAVYDDVLARTGDEAEAVFQAKEVMNFGRRGSHPVMRLLTTAIPFLNARLQGLDLLLNAARGKRNANKELDRGQAARSFIMRGATIAAVTAMYYMMVSDEEQYKEQTEEIKDNFWIVPGPDGIAFRYPIPFEVGLLFKTVPERILRYATDDATARETAASLGRGVVSTLELNPFGVQAVAPLVEVLANYSAYRGRPITPVFVDQAEAAEFQETVGTSELAKLVGQTLNVSPIKADYLVRGYTGTLGSYLLDMSDFVLRSEELKGDNRSVMPTLKLREYPVLKRFFTREFGGAEKERFYEMSNYINRFYNTYRTLYREGRTEELQRFSAGREHLLALRRDTEIIRRNLSALRRERAAILRLDISPEEKNSLVREINLRERYLLEVVPDLYKMAELPTIDVGSRLRAVGE